MVRAAAALLLAASLSAGEPWPDLTGYDPACGVAIESRDDRLRVEWKGGGERRCRVEFQLKERAPLFARLAVADAGAEFRDLAVDLSPVYIVAVGPRKQIPDRYVFFDKPADGKTERFEAQLQRNDVRVTSAGTRATVEIAPLEAGPFRGRLRLTFYAGCPLMHVEAAMEMTRDLTAYIYDAVLEGEFGEFAWKSLEDRVVREKPAGEPRPLAVRHRTIMAESAAGTLAVFPPPHAFFFPRDWTNNYGFVQRGARLFGLRQDPAGGGAFVPWFDAPKGRVQRMGMFVLLSPGKAEQALAETLRFTHGDSFLPVEGHRTFTSHWHARLAVKEIAGNSVAAEFVRVFGAMGVNIVHLAEFHGDGHRDEGGETRLKELKAMFDVCRNYSTNNVLLLPGEEGNRWLGRPTQPKEHPGHWMYLFPKPVYLTWGPGDSRPFTETIEPYGTVYHVKSTDEMVRLLEVEKGLAWSAHPRIKASYATPDAFRGEGWYKSDLWLGAAWKAMPGDLSDGRLGRRALECLDDMNHWGQSKKLVGEVDGFEVDGTHELYGHMNVNYLKLEGSPTTDDWTPVLDALRTGEFWVTTGEVLLRKVDVRKDRVTADVEWTFPLERAVVVWGEGGVTRTREATLERTGAFGRETIGIQVGLEKADWARVEFWDVAGNGSFTQPKGTK